VIECIKEEKEREEGNGIIGEGRESFYRQNGFSLEGIKLLRIRNIEVAKVLKKKTKESKTMDRSKNQNLT